MKKSELKKKWYYRLWQVLIFGTTGLAAIIQTIVHWEDFQYWLFYDYIDCGKLHLSYNCFYVLNAAWYEIWLAPALRPLFVFAFFFLLCKAVFYIIFGKLEK